MNLFNVPTDEINQLLTTFNMNRSEYSSISTHSLVQHLPSVFVYFWIFHQISVLATSPSQQQNNRNIFIAVHEIAVIGCSCYCRRHMTIVSVTGHCIWCWKFDEIFEWIVASQKPFIRSHRCHFRRFVSLARTIRTEKLKKKSRHTCTARSTATIQRSIIFLFVDVVVVVVFQNWSW